MNDNSLKLVLVKFSGFSMTFHGRKAGAGDRGCRASSGIEPAGPAFEKKNVSYLVVQLYGGYER